MTSCNILATIWPEKYSVIEGKTYTILCDASFLSNGSKAGLGVYNVTTKEKVFNTVSAGDSQVAEMMAIKMAISYALERKYKKALIIHDCENNQEEALSFAQSFSEMFDSIEIRCKGRKAVRPAHDIARFGLRQKIMRLEKFP